MNDTSDERTAMNLAESVYLRVILVARMTAAALGIVLTIALRYTRCSHFALHINAKILMNNHDFAIVLYCSSMLAMHGLDLKSYLTYKRADELMVTRLRCILGQVPMMMAWTAINMTLCMMAYERSIATRAYRSYEKRNGKDGCLLVLTQWLIVASAMAILLLNIDIPDNAPACYLISVKNNVRNSILILIMAIAESFALFSFYLILRVNQTRRKSVVDNGTLTEKYQLDENIRATKIMVPMVIAHFACLFPFMCLFVIYSLNYSHWNDRPEESYAIFRQTFEWGPYYCLIHPLVVFWRRKTLREKSKNDLRVLGLNQVQPLEQPIDGRTHEQIRHFELLNQAWNSVACTV